ncbi:hypothetical protein MUK42_03017 [Musa troglodytarum]|uniref:Uncharacterized protein n=1 Tax=Musa troglodytarum TaxID=320322 RepID=A0A9E7G0I5_9LILI|nr:hypothetical protein MUK42_03017 [Musa troglodytarum]
MSACSLFPQPHDIDVSVAEKVEMVTIKALKNPPTPNPTFVEAFVVLSISLRRSVRPQFLDRQMPQISMERSQKRHVTFQVCVWNYCLSINGANLTIERKDSVVLTASCPCAEWSSPISSDLDTAMSFSGAISYRATAFIVVAPLLVLVVIYACLWPPGVPTAFFRLHRGANTVS